MSSAAYNRNVQMHQAFSHYPPVESLSPSDLLWLNELSEGKSFKQLTGATSEGVAKNRFLRIRKFLGAKNTTQAVAKAIRNGIIK